MGKSTSRRSPPFFQKRLASKQMFKQCVKHYHQWLHSSIHLKTKFSQSSPDSIRIQRPSKRPSFGLLYPVSSVKERNRKGGKCKISLAFTTIVKEEKLMALTPGIRLHQYLDDWLIRVQSQEEAQVNTQTVVDLTQSLGWIINQE